MNSEKKPEKNWIEEDVTANMENTADNLNQTEGDINRTRQQREAQEMHDMCMKHVIRNSFFLWMIGFINNFHYCMVISAANDLADGYGFKRLVALISYCDIFLGLFVKSLSILVGTHVSYNVRVTVTASCELIGVLLVSFAGDIGGSNNTASFLIMLIGVLFVGNGYGEISILAYVQRFPNNTVGAWSSGTGISGVMSTLIFLGLSTAGLNDKEIFLCTIPFIIIYWCSFMFGMLAPHKVAIMHHVNGTTSRHTIPWGREEEFMDKLRNKAEAENAVIDDDYAIEMMTNIRGLSWRNFPHAVRKDEIENQFDENGEPLDDLYYPICRLVCGHCARENPFRTWWRHNAKIMIMMHNSMWYFYFNLGVVYIFEYSAQFMAPFSFYCDKSWPKNWWIKNSYPISQLCYQLGVLVSRSSLLCIKISAVGVLSIIQFCNMIGWLVQAKVLFISAKSSYHLQIRLCFLLFAWMIFVGLMGGASYVNVFYLVLKNCDKRERYQAKDAVAEYLTQAKAQQREPANEEKKSNDDITEDLVQKAEIGSHSDDEDSDSLVPRTQEEMDQVNEIRTKLHAIWQERREMGMNIGSLYSAIGTIIGTLLDVIFTNTLNLGKESC